MEIRQRQEKWEHAYLAPSAAFSDQTRGRRVPIDPCPIRTAYQRDRDRIIHCKAFRRLKYKTQVFISPEGDHYRTRLTHTLEVAQIARTVARALRLNEDLTEAVALGHDLGHTPFGHAGERALRKVCDQGFDHNSHSLRVVRHLEKEGRGLNLCYEVEDGIVCHTGKKKADTLEGRIIHYADRIAYINHDIDDSIRAGILTEEDIPAEVTRVLGRGHGKRIDAMVKGMIAFGERTGGVGMERDCETAMLTLRQFMFDHVYTNPVAKGEEGKAEDILQRLYDYFYRNPDKLPSDHLALMERDGKSRVVCDYIAGMTDRYAVAKYQELFVPKGWTML